MKNLLTGTAQSVTDTSERVRKLLENRPLEAPLPKERKNFQTRRPQPVAAETEEGQDENAPTAEASDNDDGEEA